ncbi:TetR family transcriptional regulator [Streptomyces roseolus]|uniref:TetR family transcriptional regulator n=1 Tax=Streptomyces roseolus TaxID=67358 RepID=UPI00364EDC95
MVKQTRAVRTRQQLLSAAAVEFDLHGYEGTSFSRLSRRAGISVGAVTFHFEAKADLAAAVAQRGTALARNVVGDAERRDGRAVDTASVLLLALGALVEREAAVRAAIRLSQEGGRAGPSWCGAWLPSFHALLEQAAARGELVPGVEPRPVAGLACHLLSGTAWRVRRRPTALPGRALEELRELWRLVCRGVVAEPYAGPPAAGPDGELRATLPYGVRSPSVPPQGGP